MTKIQVTQEGYEQLKNELVELKERRPAVLDRLGKARAMGDLRENSEYTAAKEEQGLIEGRIRELEELIKNAEVIRVDEGDHSIQIGSTVQVEVNGTSDTFHIVGEFEADPMNKKLSQSSPIGKALLGKQTGDKVEVEVPIGKIVYNIVDVKRGA
jgi:transcription elongation factor GreA